VIKDEDFEEENLNQNEFKNDPPYQSLTNKRRYLKKKEGEDY